MQELAEAYKTDPCQLDDEVMSRVLTLITTSIRAVVLSIQQES
jgi:hypothetical protein